LVRKYNLFVLGPCSLRNRDRDLFLAYPCYDFIPLNPISLIVFLLHKRIDRQPIHINSPVWPSRTLPILLIVQTSRDVDFLPDCIESSFKEINLSDLSNKSVHSKLSPFPNRVLTYLSVHIVANLTIGTKAIVPAKHAVLGKQLDNILCEEFFEGSVVFGERVVVNAVEDDALSHELGENVLPSALVDVHVGLVVPAGLAQALVDLGVRFDDVVLGWVVGLDCCVDEPETVTDAFWA
jgi:hypothetical protein